MEFISAFTQSLTHKKNRGKHTLRAGVTIIELLIVIGIIGILFAALGIIFNPFAQITKSQNANRAQDLRQIQQALDAYLNDKGCYPQSIPFGSQWSSGNTVYMSKVPEDPDCSSTNLYSCYDYQTDGTACPQWNILYATMHAPVNTSLASCIVANTASCTPQGGFQTYNYCVVSGNMECTYISQNTLPVPTVPPGSGGSGGGSGSNPTPTPSLCGQLQLSACSNKICDVENASNCIGCGGSFQCYTGLSCGGVDCSKQ